LAEGFIFGLLALVLIFVLSGLVLERTREARIAAGNIVGFLQRNGILTAQAYLAVAAAYSLVHAGLEEFYWRWFIFGGLTRLVPVGWALLLAATGFTAHHVVILGVYFGWNSWAQALCSLGVWIGGAYWCWLFHRSGNLLAPWISHIVVDIAIFAVGYWLVSPLMDWPMF
jgi:membrane protease YdiL (CAAX protease family)